MENPRPRILSNSDVWMVVLLILSALLVARPLSTGGLALYLDNPPHLAEIHGAAHNAQGGWTDDAWCGFPVGNLHSPLWYAPLVWIARSGVDVDPFYFGAVLLGFLAPALAMYRVARRSLSPAVAGAVALALLIQRPVILGVGSAFGGMWTFYLSAGFFILLVDELARTSWRVPWRPAVLTGLILISHLFPVVPVALLSSLALLIHLARGRLTRVRALALGGGLALGVLAAAWYWLPMLLAGELTRLEPQVLSPGQILARLLVPTDILAMLTNRMPAWSWDTVLGAIPMVLLAGAGVAGAFFMKRRRDDAPLYGLIIAAAVLVVLTLVVTRIDVKILGPVTWRLVYFARIGLAFSALPLLALVPLSATRPAATMVALAPIMLLLAYASGLPLVKNTPTVDSRDMADLRRTWSWLAANRQDDWGRVHLQDTFQLDPGPNGLGASHVLALTARESGVRQVGSMYSVAPYPTVAWTASEFSTLFGKFITLPADARYVAEKSWFANATHILTSDPRTAGVLKASGGFAPLFASGRFEVMRVVGNQGDWANLFADGTGLEGVDFKSGQIRIPLGDAAHPQGLMVKTTYHPFWRAPDHLGAELSQHPSGLMEIQGLDGLTPVLDLEFRPPVWPRFVSLLAVLGIGLMAWRDRALQKKAGP